MFAQTQISHSFFHIFIRKQNPIIFSSIFMNILWDNISGWLICKHVPKFGLNTRRFVQSVKMAFAKSLKSWILKMKSQLSQIFTQRPLFVAGRGWTSKKMWTKKLYWCVFSIFYGDRLLIGNFRRARNFFRYESKDINYRTDLATCEVFFFSSFLPQKEFLKIRFVMKNSRKPSRLECF